MRALDRSPRTVTRLPVVVDGHAFQRPQTRGDCLPGGTNSARPCPWVGCKYHLAVDINTHTGSLQEHGDPATMPVTCALDVADGDLERIVGRTTHENALGVVNANGLSAIGEVLGVSRERVRQIEEKALRRLALRNDVYEFGDREKPNNACRRCGLGTRAMVHKETRPEERNWCADCRKWSGQQRASRTRAVTKGTHR